MSDDHAAESDAAFYEKHYSDWTVHELPLMVSVPTKGDRDEALALIREILDEAAFDIRVRAFSPAAPPTPNPLPAASVAASEESRDV